MGKFFDLESFALASDSSLYTRRENSIVSFSKLVPGMLVDLLMKFSLSPSMAGGKNKNFVRFS
jgi:hypothetical protein